MGKRTWYIILLQGNTGDGIGTVLLSVSATKLPATSTQAGPSCCTALYHETKIDTCIHQKPSRVYFRIARFHFKRFSSLNRLEWFHFQYLSLGPSPATACAANRLAMLAPCEKPKIPSRGSSEQHPKQRPKGTKGKALRPGRADVKGLE